MTTPIHSTSTKAFLHKISIAAGLALGLSMTTGCGRHRHAPVIEDEDIVTAEPGVYEDKLVLASTAVFTGPNTSWGAETWRGSAAYLAEVNAQGGVHGRTIEVKIEDDGYDAGRAMANVRKYIERNDFLMFYDFVGSNIMIETVNELGKNREKSLYQFASIASTSAYRSGPNADLAFSVRAPIALEMKHAVDQFVSMGKKKIAVFHQADAYGKSGLEGVTAALAAHGLKPVAVTTHTVFQKFDDSVRKEVDVMKAAGAEVVFDIGNPNAAAALVRDARESKWLVPIVNNASINDSFVRTMATYEKKTNSKIAINVVGVKVVPSPEELAYPLVREYRQLIDRRNPRPPFEYYRFDQYSFQSVEGFVNAKIMVECLKRMGPKPAREKLRAACESITTWDVGLNEAKVTFGSEDHTALDRVWLYSLVNGKWLPFDDTRTAALAGDRDSGKLAMRDTALAAAKKTD